MFLFEIFKNTYFEEHLQTTTSDDECLIGSWIRPCSLFKVILYKDEDQLPILKPIDDPSDPKQVSQGLNWIKFHII